ncbi:hypothetical protein VTO73DRAFT_10411 [Trametes versicolor]
MKFEGGCVSRGDFADTIELEGTSRDSRCTQESDLSDMTGRRIREETCVIGCVATNSYLKSGDMYGNQICAARHASFSQGQQILLNLCYKWGDTEYGG